MRNRFSRLTTRRIEISLERLRFLGEYHRHIKTRFEFARDHRDEKFLELCISAGATHLLSYDDDLLSLRTAHADPAKRLRRRAPSLRINTPSDFLDEYDRILFPEGT